MPISKIKMHTYVQAVKDEKARDAEEVVILPVFVGSELAFWTRGKMAGACKCLRVLASRTGVEPVSPP